MTASREKLREKIARIVNPNAFELAERYAAKWGGEPRYDTVGAFLAYEAADAILSLLSTEGNSSAQSQPGCAPKSATSGSEPSGAEGAVERLSDLLDLAARVGDVTLNVGDLKGLTCPSF